jgi:hypothetical protein
VANNNPILNTRLYKVEYPDGHRAALSANIIPEKLLSQVDQDGHRALLLGAIIGHHTDGSEVQEGKATIKSANGVKGQIETTVGWEVQLEWKDGQTTWNKLKDIKDSYPVQMAEYAVENVISELPAFRWWVPYVLKKCNRIIAKTKTCYWAKMH